MIALNDKQRQAIEKLEKYKVGALFMEPGTGKTRVAYHLIKSVKNLDYILWLTPFQTKENLRKEIEELGGLPVDIQGIESLSNSDRLFIELYNKFENAKKSFVVVDESLKIKNITAKRTQRIIMLGDMAEYKLILNGTPLSRNLLDVWTQMRFLSPKILNMDYGDFKNNFVEYVQITIRKGFRKITKEFINDYHNVDVLMKMISPFVFESNLELSAKKKYINIDYELTEEELINHELLKEKYLSDVYMLFRNNNIFLEITQKIQHNYSLSPEKIEIVKKLTKGREKSFIIFAKYIDTQEYLKKKFPDIHILSWQKHAFGLNLQKYNRIIFFDKVWDYALRDQAEHRIFRIGQESDVIFYDLTGNVGLEKMINENIEKKKNLLNTFKKMTLKQLRNEL